MAKPPTVTTGKARVAAVLAFPNASFEPSFNLVFGFCDVVSWSGFLQSVFARILAELTIYFHLFFLL
ncbi:MAG: hypothetical protein ACYCQI_08465 [Gammaproteobacteria bacterium]